KTSEFGLNTEITFDGINPLLNSLNIYNGNPNSTTHTLGAYVMPSFFYNASDNYNLNFTAYNDIAPIHVTPLFAVNTYVTPFLVITSSISHVLLWNGKTIYRQTKNALSQMRDEVDSKDVHVKLMEAYPDVPDWIYLVFLTVATVLIIVISVFTPFSLPWWAAIFNVILCMVCLVPIGFIQAITGYSLNINTFSEFIIGLIIPGQTVPVMTFKSLATNNVLQAIALVSDLKLGQYLHIPPYAMLAAQFTGSFINAVVCVFVAYYMMFDSGDLLGSPQWTYTYYSWFYNMAGIGGAVGPRRFFGDSSVYHSILWSFLVGAIAPVLPWLGNKFIRESKYWEYINFPILFNVNTAGGYQNKVVMQTVVAWFGQVYVFNRYNEWYEKYMYVFGSAADVSSALAILLISILAIYGIKFTNYNVFNPATNVDYYCWPDWGYLDYGCEYYLGNGLNVTSTGISCVVS
ncbi:hypothetical protein HK100_003926, partial [Physocladia obscura]